MRFNTSAGLALISASALLSEITLTRLFALAQWYHFAFMAVGIGLLGFGASGTLLAIVPARWTETIVAAAAIAAIPTTAAAYLTLHLVPFDAYRLALEPLQFAYLGLQIVMLVGPFLCAGLVVGGTLARNPVYAGKLYGASLVGSGAGCLLAVGTLEVMPATNALFIAVALSAVGAGTLWGSRRLGGILAVVAAAALLAAWGPEFPLRSSPYKALNQYRLLPDSQLVFTRWSAVARVDAIRSRAIHAAPGLSTSYQGIPPAMAAVTIDGDAPRPLPESAQGDFTPYLPSSTVYALRRGPTLIINGGAGLDVLAALYHGMPRVVVADGNRGVVEAARTLAQPVFGQPRVVIVPEDGRVFGRHTRQAFAIIAVSPQESFQVVASGAFSLTEHYLYTVEALTEFIQVLAPDGILVLTRWLQQPPSEEARLWATAATALEELGLDPAAHLAAIRSLNTMTILVSRRPWTLPDLDGLRQFASSRRFDVVSAPGLTTAEANRYNVLPEDIYYATFAALLRSPTRAAAIGANPFDIQPTRDSRPFFFHFFRWHQIPTILRTLGRTWQPFGGGGYLVLLATFVVELLLAAALILLPLRRLGPVPPRAGAIFGYFLLLGIGYLFVEISTLQQFILLLGFPTYALSVVLFGLLTASGVGSLLAHRVQRIPIVLTVLAIAVVFVGLGTGPLIRAALGAPLTARILATLGVVGVLGLPMGVPFAAGLRALADRPMLVPWAWAINGCASVVSSTAAMLVAVQWGYPAVLILGAAAYALAGVMTRQILAHGTRG